jgi:hypothetical protein
MAVGKSTWWAGPGAHPASCTMGTGFFPGVESGRGVTLTPHPLLVPRSKNSRAIPLLSLRVFVAYEKGENCVDKSTFYVICHNGVSFTTTTKFVANYAVRWANFSGPVHGTRTVLYGGPWVCVV